MPSHHQMDFIEGLHEVGVDLQVRFFGEVNESRRRMGWDANPKLEQNAKYVRPSIDALDESVPDWRTRIHIVAGTVGDLFLMDLVDRLIRERVGWCIGVNVLSRDGIALHDYRFVRDTAER